MFNEAAQDWVRAQAIRLIRPFSSLPITPNWISTIGLLFTVFVAWLIGAGHPLAGGIVFGVSSITDIADGALARARNTCNDYGAFYDSLLDRIGEAIIGLGILVYYINIGHAMEGAVLAYLSVSGGLMVSYARARAEGLGLECNVGFMARPERIIISCAGLILAPFGLWILTASLYVLVVTTIFTTAQRLWHVYCITKPASPVSEIRPRLLRRRRIAS